MFSMEKVVPKIKKDVYELDNGEYLLIKTLQDLTASIEKLRRSML